MDGFALSLVGKLWYLPIQFKSHRDDAYLARTVTQDRKITSISVAITR